MRLRVFKFSYDHLKALTTLTKLHYLLAKRPYDVPVNNFDGDHKTLTKSASSYFQSLTRYVKPLRKIIEYTNTLKTDFRDPYEDRLLAYTTAS